MTILTKFISNKEPNSYYISLVSLLKIAQMDVALLENHKEMILELLQEPDNSIKSVAMDLLTLMVNA